VIGCDRGVTLVSLYDFIEFLDYCGLEVWTFLLHNLVLRTHLALGNYFVYWVQYYFVTCDMLNL
jgi:hypothetical protein